MKLLICIFLAVIVSGCNVLNLSHDKVEKRENIYAEIEFDSNFAEALKQKILGNYFQSEELLFKCIKLQPQNSAVFYELSMVYLSLGKSDLSLSYGLKAVRYDNSNEWYLLQVSKLYRLTGNLDSSLFYYKKIVKVKPEKCEYRLKLAQLYYEKKEYNFSLKTLNKVEHEFGYINEIFLARYKNYLALSNNKKCIETLNLAIKKYPYEPRYYGLLAEHYASIGYNDKALAYYKQLLKLDPNNERGYLSLIDFYRNSGKKNDAIDFARNFILNDEFSFDNKIDVLSSFIRDQTIFNDVKGDIKFLLDSLNDCYPEILKCHLLLSDYYVRLSNFDKALSELLNVIDKSRYEEDFWEQFFYILGLKNDYSSIYKYSSEALSYLNKSPVVYLYRGISAFRLKLFSEAVDNLTNGLKFTGGAKKLEFKYYNYLGETFNALKEFPKSDFCFDKAINIDPSNSFLLNNYSYYLSLRNERLDKALVYINRSVELEPSNYLFLDTYAWILFKTGQNIEAKRMIERAYILGGERHSVVLEHYCEILLALDLKEDALKVYKKLKTLGKENFRLKAILNIQE